MWGVLQTLGIAGIVTIWTLPLDNKKRTVIALAIIAIYGLLLTQNQTFFDSVESTRHGGPLGALSYGAITIFGLVAGQMLTSKRGFYKNATLMGLSLIILSAAIAMQIPYNKLLVTPSYSMITAGGGFITLAFLKYLYETDKRENQILIILGRNSFLAWIFQYPLLFYPLHFLGYGIIGFLEGIFSAAIFTIVVYAIVNFMHNRSIKLKI